MERIYEIQMGIEELARRALETGTVGGVAALLEVPETNKIAFTLVRAPEDVKGLAPFSPWMLENAARSISQMTREAAFTQPVAVILRPCELRALRELVKLKQVNMTNLILISFDCPGVFPIGSRLNGNGDLPAAYEKAVLEGTNCPGIRQVCSACEEFVPRGADMVISLVGRSPTDTLRAAFPTEAGQKFAEALGLLAEGREVEAGEERDRLAGIRADEHNALSARIQGSLKDLDGLVSVFDRCISCHACRYVCPVCYCKDCFFESPAFSYYPHSLHKRLEQSAAGLRLPLDRLLFHLGRLTHMGASCVACGMCEDVCVAGIPVSQIFKTVGGDIQQMFDYLPGGSPDDPLPLLTYREDELKEMED